jgi:hypothetical protein
MEKETIIKKLIKYNLNLLHRFLTFLHPLSTMPEEKLQSSPSQDINL